MAVGSPFGESGLCRTDSDRGNPLGISKDGTDRRQVNKAVLKARKEDRQAGNIPGNKFPGSQTEIYNATSQVHTCIIIMEHPKYTHV